MKKIMIMIMLELVMEVYVNECKNTLTPHFAFWHFVALYRPNKLKILGDMGKAAPNPIVYSVAIIN